MGDVKRYDLVEHPWGMDTIYEMESDYPDGAPRDDGDWLRSEDYNALENLRTEDKIRHDIETDALRARAVEADRGRDAVAERLAELLGAIHEWKGGLGDILLQGDSGQRVTTAYTKAIVTLAATPSPTQEPAE